MTTGLRYTATTFLRKGQPMAARDPTLRIADRSAALFANALIFYCAFILSSGRWMPGGALDSAWFFASVALWFVTLLSAPWFVPPRDAFANAIASIIFLTTLDLSHVGEIKSALDIVRFFGVIQCALVGLFAGICLFASDDRTPGQKLLFRLTSNFGRPELLYLTPAVISIVGAYSGRPVTMAWLVILWLFFVVARPVERSLAAYRNWGVERGETRDHHSVGHIERIDHPDIVRVALTKATAWNPGNLYTAAMSDGDQRFVLALFSQLQGAEVVGTGLCVGIVADP